MRFILDDWRARLKHWSTQLNALGLLIMSWIQFDPVSALAVWNMMPGPVAHQLPNWLVTAVGGTIFALSLIAKFVVQPVKAKPNGQ